MPNDSNQYEDDDDHQIIGVYSTQDWSAPPELLCAGDSSSFIFNLTQNLRLNANPDCHSHSNLENGTNGGLKLCFGQQTFCMEDNFRVLTSEISQFDTENSPFTFGQDRFMLKNNVNSLIPGRLEIGAAAAVEVWSFYS